MSASRALGTPIVTRHAPELSHALKEVHGASLATAETSEQVVRILGCVSHGWL